MTTPIDRTIPEILPSPEPSPQASPQLGRMCTRLIRDDIAAARGYLDEFLEFFKKEP